MRKGSKDPLKQWKFSESDIIGYRLWKQYILAYEEMLSKCGTNQIPWHIIPANNKWFRNFTVAKIILNALENMDLKFPKPKIDVFKNINVKLILKVIRKYSI